MRILGTSKQQVYNTLKAFCLRDLEDHVVFIPTLIPISTAAASPKGKKKYTRMNVDLAIDRAIFKQQDSIHMLLDKTLEISVVMAIPKHHFNDDGLNHYDTAISNMETQLDRHPELKELLDEFLPKWKAAFDRAVEVEASEKLPKLI